MPKVRLILLLGWLAALMLININPVAAANVDPDKRWPTRSIDVVICDSQRSDGFDELCKPQKLTKNSSSNPLHENEATTVRNAISAWNALFIQNIQLREVFQPTRDGAIVFRTSARHRRCSTKRVGYSSVKPNNYISIGSHCNVSQEGNRTSEGVVMHEILHAIGFYHEQERTDRANFLSLRERRSVRVAWGLDCRRKIKKCSKGKRGDRNGRYDFASIMHYSLEGKRASGSQLTRKGNFKLDRMNAIARDIGQRDGLSSGDIYAVYALYPNRQQSDARRRAM